jgi:hypothetical protein
MSGKSIVRSIAFIGLVAVPLGVSPVRAQQPNCRYLKVSTDKLNVFSQPTGDADFIGQLKMSDVVCVVGDQQAGGRNWAHVAFTHLARGQQNPLNGWAIMTSLQAASPAEVAALRNPPQPPPPSAPVAASPAPTQPAPAAPNGGFGQAIIKFSTPITEGPVPVNGVSLEQLVAGIPSYPPIEGLPDAVWKKHCSSCHNWNQQTLCVQANIYAKDPKMTMRIQHPFGGPEKIAMMKWAQGGCQ